MQKLAEEMKKGLHPQQQWISYVTQSGRLMHAMMTKIHHVGKVYHLRAKRQMQENEGEIQKYRRRYGLDKTEDIEKDSPNASTKKPEDDKK